MKSKRLTERAQKVSPGGVHTSLRRTEPLIIWNRAEGSKIYDLDGREYIDYHLGFGPIILGHCHPKVTATVTEQIERGDLFGSGTNELEIEVAEKIIEHVPSAEMVLFCNTGSEATYHAIRVSRAVKKRKKIIKFEGHYHGWHDYTCINYSTPPEHIGKLWPESAGMLRSTINETIVLPYNDVEAVRNAIKRNKGDIAAIILEPIMHNCGCILPENGYLETLRELTIENDIFLIFDEVITGFRHDLGGVQKIFGIKPDISTFAKSMANGYPIAAICGRTDVMKRFKTSKDGDVFFAGTYNAHPISLAAAKATIGELEKPEIYRRLYRLGKMMRENLSKAAEEYGIIAQVKGFGSIFITYFTNTRITKYEDIPNGELNHIRIKYRRGMLENGVFMIPFRLKRNYISSSHTEEDVKKTVESARKIFQKLKNQP